MKEEIVSFKTAKLARKKGFNISCEHAFDKKGTQYSWDMYAWFNDDKNQHLPFSVDFDKYYRPTQSLLQKWLREKHNINIVVDPADLNNYGVIILNHSKDNSEWVRNGQDLKYFKTYEEALEEGLQEALKLIK